MRLRNESLAATLLALCLFSCGDADDPSGAAGAGTSGTGAGAAAGSGGGDGAAGNSGDAGGALDSGAGTAGDQDASASDAGGAAGTNGGNTCVAPAPSDDPGNTCPSTAPVPLTATLIESGLAFPVYVTHAPGDPAGRLFIVERAGTIRILENGSLRTTPFLDLNVVSSFNEQGLLGLAFDPEFADTGRFFVNYIGPRAFGTETIVESYVVSGNPNVADETTKTPFLSFDQPEANHNGGMLEFGPDGCLYIATGDGGGSNDPGYDPLDPSSVGNGQRLDTELGKILRMHADDPSATAPGNLAGAAFPHIWDYGLRNPWRFSFDRKTGDLYIADVGQGAWEEINVEAKGTGHQNYGWRNMEGKHCRGSIAGAPSECDGVATSSFTPPVHDYGRSAGKSVIGGYVYRGSNIPSLDGHYVFGDYDSNRIWAFVWDGSRICGDAPIELSSQLTLNGSLTSFGEDADGELYITTDAGNLYRIDAE